MRKHRSSCERIESHQLQSRGLSSCARLRVSGWTMVGTGAVLFGTGMGFVLSTNCRGPAGCVGDEDMYQRDAGFAVLAVGLAAAVGVGMPTLIRARKLKLREDTTAVYRDAAPQVHSRIQLRVGPGSLMLRGAF